MLSQFITSELFAFLLVFCRVGSAVMLLPGFSESYVPTRIRLLIAVLLSLLIAPVLHKMPVVPSDVPSLFIIIIGEIMTGLFLGGLSRMLISSIHIAGFVIAYQSGLSASITVGLGQLQGQDTALGNLLSFTTVVLLFATNMHHVMLRGLADSYSLFLPGQFPVVQDFANHATHMMSGAFTTAMQLAAPSIVVGTVMNLGAGILSRLMPNFQIFFIMIAPQLLVSFCILMATISGMMLWYMDTFHETLNTFLKPAG